MSLIDRKGQFDRSKISIKHVYQYTQNSQELSKYYVMPYINYNPAYTLMRENCVHMFIIKFGIFNPTKCVDHFDIDKSLWYLVQILQFYIMYGLGMCLNFKSHITQMFNIGVFYH